MAPPKAPELITNCQVVMSMLNDLNMTQSNKVVNALAKVNYSLPKVLVRLQRVDNFNTSSTILTDINIILRELTTNIEQIKNNQNPDIEKFDNLGDRLLQIYPFIAVTDRISDEENQENLRKVAETMSLINSNFQESQSAIEKIKSAEQNYEKLLHVKSGKILNNEYENRAKSEEGKADSWTKLTWVAAVSAFIFLVAIFIYQFLVVTTNNEINYQLLSSKILITATLGLFAKWTSKRSNHHLTEANKYHRLAINIATIDSFIASLEQTDKNAIISAVALKIFTETNATESAAEFETPNVLDMIKNIGSK